MSNARCNRTRARFVLVSAVALLAPAAAPAASAPQEPMAKRLTTPAVAAAR